MYTEQYVKPVREYVDVESIEKCIESLSIEDVLDYLSEYGILVWKIEPGIFIVLDPLLRKHRYSMRASMICMPEDEEYLIQAAIELLYGVKLYTERDLRNILKGLAIHKEYATKISFFLECKCEVPFYDKTRNLVGRADLVCHDCVIEIKCGLPSKNHILQLLIYMDQLNKRLGFLVYKDTVQKYSLSNKTYLAEAYNKLKERYLKTMKIAKNIENYMNRFLRRFGLKVSEVIEALENMEPSPI